MAHEDPNSVPLLTYIWVMGLSLLSAVAGYLSRYLKDQPPQRPLLNLMMDICYCELAGLTTYFFTQAADMPPMQSILFVSIGSHMGARLMFTMQYLISRQIKINISQQERE